jgi:DMSO/TMAO reductase YedYZ molybdopterin-dependent catalytic subunit
MRPRVLLLLLCAVVLSALLPLATACARLVPPSATPVPPAASQEVTASAPTTLPAVEIRNYRGKRLDAVRSEPEVSIHGPQTVDVARYRLSIAGRVAKPLSLAYQEVVRMRSYQKVTKLACIEGWAVTYLWQGVRIKDLLTLAEYDPTAQVVIFRCYDGYTTSLPLSYVVDNDILLAYRMNGVPMPAERGFPFQVVAEDRYGYKWAKWVTAMEVSDDTRFRGYWESRGADNTATIPGR